MNIEMLAVHRFLPLIIAGLFMIWWQLLLIWWQLSKINSRLKERFPTEKEQDYKWALEDPLGHWEAHNKKGGGESSS